MHPTPAQFVTVLGTPPRATPGDLAWPRVHWSDDLEGALNWAILSQTGTASCTISTAGYHTGMHSLRTATRTVDKAEDDQITVDQICTAPAEDYWTLDVWLDLPAVAPAKEWDLQLASWTGGHIYTATLKHLTAAHKFQYINAAGASTDVPAGGYNWPATTWVHITLQIRRSTLQWGTVTWPAGSADLSAQGLRDGGADAGSGARLLLQAVASANPPIILHSDTWRLLHGPTP